MPLAKRSTSPIARPSRENIEAIARLERDALEKRSWAERLSENTVKFIGSITFLLLNILLLVLWTAINLNFVPGITAFDRFPFGILALIVSAESIVLTIFVLIGQNRLVRQSEKRSHLDLQIGLLAEQELTAVIEMLHKLCEHSGVNVDSSRHAKTFGNATDLDEISRELDEKLPSSE